MEFVFDEYRIDADRRELRRGRERVGLEPQVFDVLLYLVRHRDRVVTKDDLVAGVWGGRIVSDSTLTSRINAARKAVGDSGAAQRFIRTLPRKGIRFVAPVEEECDAPAERVGPPRLSIVVLPFANLSNDPDQEYFADGIADDLTTDLARISGSFVIARSTAFTYKGKAVDVQQIGRDLGVRYVLEGSVRRTADQAQVNVQLIDAASGGHIWAERFDTDRRSLPSAQNEITGRLAQTLNLELVKDVGRRIEREKLVDPDAQDLVMRGWFWYHQPRSANATAEAERCFERAMAIDPSSVEARVGLARALTVRLIGNFESRPSGGLRDDGARVERLLVEAIERDPNHAGARATMGQLRRLQNRLVEARIEFATAIALGANDEFVHGQYAWTLLLLGEPEAAIAEAETTLRVSPRDPTLWGTFLVLGWCRLLLNEAESAIDLLTKSRAANPRPWVTHFGLAGAFGLIGDINSAKAAVAEALKLNPGVGSLEGFRAYRPWGDPLYWALFENTAAVGFRRAGLPDA